MGKADRLSGIFWLIFAVIIAIKSYRLGLGKVVEPGPGFLFFWAGIVLGIMSLVIIIGSFDWKKAGEPDKPILGVTSFRKIILVLAAVFLYALLIEILGFILVTLMLFVFILGVVEKKKVVLHDPVKLYSNHCRLSGIQDLVADSTAGGRPWILEILKRN